MWHLSAVQLTPSVAGCSSQLSCPRLQVVLAVGGRTLVYLELSGEGQIVEKGRLQLDSDIACLDITPVGEQGAC